jgi:hypothetical protein
VTPQPTNSSLLLAVMCGLTLAIPVNQHAGVEPVVGLRPQYASVARASSTGPSSRQAHGRRYHRRRLRIDSSAGAALQRVDWQPYSPYKPHGLSTGPDSRCAGVVKRNLVRSREACVPMPPLCIRRGTTVVRAQPRSLPLL